MPMAGEETERCGRARPIALPGAPLGQESRGLASLVGLRWECEFPALRELVLNAWIFLRCGPPPS